MIVAFFRFYLLVMAIPISTVGLALFSFEFFKEAEVFAFWASPIGWLLLVFALIGLLLMRYMTGLRLEALLYARTVNSIRSYFLKDSDFNPVLPIEREKPSFHKLKDHKHLVLACAAFDTVYAVAGIALLMLKPGGQLGITLPENFSGICVLVIVFSFALHFFWAQWTCNRRENIPVR